MTTTNTYKWDDPFRLDDQLSEEERLVRDTARNYAQDKLMPRILEANRNEHFDPEIILEMGALGLLGSTLPQEYGGAGVNHVCYGLTAREIERVEDSRQRALRERLQFDHCLGLRHGTPDERLSWPRQRPLPSLHARQSRNRTSNYEY